MEEREINKRRIQCIIPLSMMATKKHIMRLMIQQLLINRNQALNSQRARRIAIISRVLPRISWRSISRLKQVSKLGRGFYF